MKKLFVAAALAVTLAQPAAAVTFPALTTIYVGAGVYDDNVNIATSVSCSNVSGKAANMRWQFVAPLGGPVPGGIHTQNIAHGETITVSTHATPFNEQILALTSGIAQGVVNVESTESGVFCSAFIVNRANAAEAVALHMVRVNPHPGTVE
jgi:hypothetical protein